MSRLVLLGNPGSKRTIFFQHAAEAHGLHVCLCDWKQWKQHGFPETVRGSVVKIDPPAWEEASFSLLGKLTAEYQADLGRLAGEPQVEFFNAPEDLIALLDKKRCKDRLRREGVAVTEELQGEFSDEEVLFSRMREQRMGQVFIKPRFASGAAGVTALRVNFATGQMAAYSCARVASGQLVNTKHLWSCRSREEVLPLLRQLLAMDCIVERWHPKARHQGHSYDLRAVVQGGQVDFVLARLSKGPITNLHLNNQPLKLEQLGLPDKAARKLQSLCLQASSCYPKLSSVGIDVLLERESLCPRVIEMNGQGDLIYQDIYHHNRIYGHQVEMMARRMGRTICHNERQRIRADG